MRLFLPVLALGLLVSACGKDEAADDGRKDSTMTAEAIESNDVTAIDAVTGEAANMAEDVNFTEDLGNSLENAAEREAGKPRPARSRPAASATTPAASAPTPAPAAEPASNNTE